MRVCVLGLWHLGTVTAACLADHFDVVGWNPDAAIVRRLSEGTLPIAEPGLAELVGAGLASNRLSFATDLATAVQSADVTWVTFDTPVDENDVADVEFVERHIVECFQHLGDDSVLLISSQVPVGTCARLEASLRECTQPSSVQLAYSPENLRLRVAIERFRNPDRVVLGIRDPSARSRLAELFAPFSQALEWMSMESAEMAKHAVNAFLATSISFTNELASLCEVVGADARDVERALRSELRIGRQAYVSAGAAFAGGTLARDVRFLTRLGDDTEIPALLFHAVSASNDAHKDWPRRKLRELLPTIKDAHIAVLGLTYKPGTDTLRRSASLELCGWLLERGAHVLAYDPAVRELPLQLSAVRMCTSPEDALAGADAAVLATEWPMFRSLTAETFVGTMRNAVVGDPNRFLGADVQDDDRIRYAAVGVPARAL